MLPIEETTVSRLKKYAAAFWEIKIYRKVGRKRGGAAFLTQCLGVKNVVDTPFPAIPLVFLPQNIGPVSDERGESFHLYIYPEWKTDTAANGTKCAGCC